jgi:hypothetical protein
MQVEFAKFLEHALQTDLKQMRLVQLQGARVECVLAAFLKHAADLIQVR